MAQTKEQAMTIISSRLIIREFTPQDIPSIHHIATQKEFEFYSLDGTRENAQQFVETAITHARKSCRTSFKMAVAQPCDPETCIGYVALDDIHGQKDGVPDIGYLIDPKHQGRGYATEAMQALMRDSYNRHAALDKIWLTVHPDNIASQKVAHKIGFRQPHANIVNKAYGPRLEYNINRTAFYANITP